MERRDWFTRSNGLRRIISQLAMLMMLMIAGADAKGDGSEFYKNKFDDIFTVL